MHLRGTAKEINRDHALEKRVTVPETFHLELLILS